MVRFSVSRGNSAYVNGLLNDSCLLYVGYGSRSMLLLYESVLEGYSVAVSPFSLCEGFLQLLSKDLLAFW